MDRIRLPERSLPPGSGVLARLAGVVIAACVLALAVPVPVTANEPFEIFQAAGKKDPPTDWAAVLSAANVPEPADADGKAARERALKALALAERQPSMATAIGLLKNFAAFAGDDPFRKAVFAANLDVFLMADAAKYELVLQTNKKIHAARGLTATVRVGSSGARFAAWAEWARQGRPIDRPWTFTDPLTNEEIRYTGMPVDPAYRDEKLFKSDDDVTNWAGEDARRRDPGANEDVNGERAATVFAEVTREYLRDYPEIAQGEVDPLDGERRVHPAKMSVEFLSPTRAYAVMGSKAARAKRGWQAQAIFTGTDGAGEVGVRPGLHFLGEWILANPEKYNGLYAEEQLHKWGIEKGYVIEDPNNPRESLKPYKESATDGKLAPITGADVFPEAVKDPFGWMATNYRQTFVTHAGDLDSVAKYTLRMMDWWQSVGLSDEDIANTAAELAQDDPAFNLNIAELQALADGIRNPEDGDAKRATVNNAGGAEVANEKLKRLNTLVMLAGQRRHVRTIATTLLEAVKADNAERTARERAEAPLTFDDILKRMRTAAGDDAQRNYFDFERSIDAFANAYANLPEVVARQMAADMARFIQSGLVGEDVTDQTAADLRLKLLPALKDSVARARQVGGDMKSDAAGLADLSLLARSDLGKALNEHLADLGQPDLDAYLLRIASGEVRKKRRRLIPGETEDGWPKLEVVDKVMRPSEVADDLKRIDRLAKYMKWSNETYAARLAAYFNGPTGDGNAPAEDGKTYADVAIEGYLGFIDLFSPARSKTEFVEIEMPDGQRVTLQLSGSRFVDPAVSLGHVMFSQGMKGARTVHAVWGVKGDLESVAKWAVALKTLAAPEPGLDRQKKAVAMATAAAETLSLIGAAEKLANDTWKNSINAGFGEETIVGKAGNTFGSLLSNANDLFSEEAQEQLVSSAIKDLLIWAQPQLAVAFTLHGIYSEVSAYVVTGGARSRLVDFLAKNGDWSFPSDGKPPTLNGLYAFDRYYTDDAAARAEQCKLRQQRATLIGEQGTLTPVGIERVFTIPEPQNADGSPICLEIKDGQCLSRGGGTIKPREEILTLFGAAKYNSADIVLRSNKEAIEGYLGLNAFWRVLTWDDGSKWTRKRLAENGIFPPTPEDAISFVRQPIRVSNEPLVSRVGYYSGTVSKHPTWVQSRLEPGARKVLGYLSSQYWVRRQYLIDCKMLDPLIQAASRIAEKQELETVAEVDTFRTRLADLDRRVRLLDQRVWPEIAPPADPYPRVDGDKERPADEKLAIYAHYLDFTAPSRRDLRDTLDWLTDPKPDTVPWPALMGATGSAQAERLSADAEGRLVTVKQLALHRAREVLTHVAGVVARYEDEFGKALGDIAGLRKLVAGADGYALGPAHLHLLEPDSFAPPNGRYGEVEDHLFPAGSNTAPSGLDENRNPLFDGLSGTMSHRIADWRKGYGARVDTVVADLAGVVSAFQTAMRDFGTGAMGLEQAMFNPVTGLLDAHPEDLAKRHPFYPRMLRIQFQMEKLTHAAADAARSAPADTKALVDAMRIYAPADAEAGDAVAMWDWVSAAVGDPEDAAAVYALMQDAMAVEYRRLLDLARDPFELQVETEIAGPSIVLNDATYRGEAMPHANTEITPDEITTWSKRHVWEVVRTGTDPAQPHAAAPEGEAAALAGPVSPVLQSTCTRLAPDPTFDRAFRITETGDKPALKLPYASPGPFKARLTVMTRDGVPLQQALFDFTVDPATLRGEIVQRGTVDLSDTSIGYLVQAGPRTAIKSAWSARFDVAGPFEMDLCGPYAEQLIEFDGAKWVRSPDDRLAGTLAAQAIQTEGAQAMETSTMREIVITASQPGRLRLDGPLELGLPPETSISVEVSDASDAPIPDADVDVLGGGESFAGPPPIVALLAPGDPVRARARLETPGGVADGESPARAFDPQRHRPTMVFEVELPVYLPGNLRVFGAFRPADGIDDVPGIARGELWSNLSGQAAVPVAEGGAFEFTNDDVALLRNGFAGRALLIGSDEAGTLLAPAGPVLRSLTTGGELELNPVYVVKYRTPAVSLEVRATDWAGLPIEDGSVRVEVDGTVLEEKHGRYVGSARFSAVTLPMTVTYPMPDGRDVVRTVDIPLSEIGDPFAPTDPPPIEVRLPVYPVGSLQVAMTARFADRRGSDGSIGLDVAVGEREGAAIDRWSLLVEEDARLDLSFPVRPLQNMFVAAAAKRDGVSHEGRTSGPAPGAPPQGLPAVIDLGTLELLPDTRLVDVPDLRNLTPEEARRRLGSDFVLVERPGDRPETPDDEGLIQAHTPPGSMPGAPSKAPAGSTITAKVSGQSLKVYVPQANGFAIGGSAESIIADADLVPKPTSLGRADGDRSPKIVLDQTPAPGALVLRGSTVTLPYYDPPAVIAASPAPEPEPEAPPVADVDLPGSGGDAEPGDGQPGTQTARRPEPENELGATPSGTPVAGGDAWYEGGWQGVLRLEHATLRIPSEGVTLACDAYPPCARAIVTILADMGREAIAEKREREREEAGETGAAGALGAVAGIGGAAVDGALDGIAIAMLVGAAPIAVAATDMAFAGIDYGFMIEAGEGTLGLRIPGVDEAAQQSLKQIRLIPKPDGTLALSLPSMPFEEGSGAMTGTLTPSGEDQQSSALAVTMNFSGESGESGVVKVAGEFTRTAIVREVDHEALLQRAMAALQTPKPEYIPLLEPLKKLAEELQE